MKRFVALLLFLIPPFLVAAERQSNPLSPEELKWGETQVKRMLHDRPAMKKYVRKGDPLWDWTVRQFAGEWVEGGVEWDPSDPEKLWNAMFYPKGKDTKARIQVTEKSVLKNYRFGEKKEGPQLWNQVIFELCNVKVFSGAAARNRWMTLTGRITGEEYAFKQLLTEAVDTRKEVHRVSMNIWVPNCVRLKLEPWDDYLKSTGNVGAPFSSERGFINSYFSVDFEHPRPDVALDEDMGFHRRHSLDQYEKYYKPWMIEHHIPIPPEISMNELKQKMIEELLGGSPPYALDAERLKFGENQMRRMLRDRPAMKKYVREGDALWTWGMRQFAGEYCKGGVEWEAEAPEGGFDSVAYHAFPDEGKKARIRVAKNYSLKYFHPGEAKKAPELWYEAAIELCNLMSSKRFEEIEGDAKYGVIGREDYIFRMMAVEDIVTNDRIYGFVTEVWEPHCEKKGLLPRDERFVERWGAAPAKGWTKEAFLEAFKSLGVRSEDGGKSAADSYVAKDLREHYNHYGARYDRYAPAFLKEKNMEAMADKSWDQREAYLAWLNEDIVNSTGSRKLRPAGDALLVDDFEVGGVRNHLSGDWTQYADQNNLGTKLGKEYFVPVEGGCPKSDKFAGRIWGHFGRNEAPWPFAQMWTFLSEFGQPVDISAFSSVRFYARGDGKPYLLILGRSSIADYANYQVSFSATKDWGQVTLTLADFKQPSWGKRVEKGWEDVVSLMFGVEAGASSDKDFDLWIDDVELVK
jgi:hypothetical protein